ncbi:hypothetical protein AB0F72_27685 [Actinoplanes sp. NPDC023936]|uniref:hypothetical protein n=1 Tax=Actinoplanes sp. NPDC023936 TaxID=3154910 RepID=UPI00340297DF
MNDSMKDLHQLAVLDPARGREPSQLQWTRSRAFVERTMAGEVTGRPAHAARRRWIAAGAVAMAVGAVAAVTVPALVPGAAEKAVASWTATPTARTGAQVLPQAKQCAESGAGGSSTAFTPSDVLLAEQRGEATMLIMRKDDGAAIECLIVGGEQFASMTLGAADSPAPAATAVNLVTRSSQGDGDSEYSNAVGLAGPGVTGVEVRLDNGKTFQASVASGWWGAWWPGPAGGEADGFAITVHTTDRTVTYRAAELS